MGLLRWLGLAKEEADVSPPPPLVPSRRGASFALQLPAEMTEGGGALVGAIHPRISRQEALQVPAVLRARNLVCGSLATLPIRVHGPDRSAVPAAQYLLPQPDPELPQSVVAAQTVEDLLFEGVAWWRVTRFGWHSYPVEARHVPVASVTVGGSTWPAEKLVSPDQQFPVDGQVYIDGVPVPDEEIIRFDSPNPPLLVHAARAIRTCLKLDRAAALYSDDPLPLGYFAPKEGADPATEDEVQEVLDAWEEARSKRAWGYVNAALDAKTLQWSPEQLQLADARQHAVLEIARAVGVDPEDLGVSTTSRTYQNSEQRRQDLLDFTLGAYVSAIQDRLSMRDVLPRGYVARIDFAGFLRSDTKTRMDTYEVGLRVGAYTVEEIRELENRPPLPRGAARAPAPTPLPVPEETQMSTTADATFADDATQRVTFDGEQVAASFRVNPEKRTISGLLMPWDVVGRSGHARYRFAKDSLQWVDQRRVKLFRDHDYTQPIGVAIRLDSGDAGLDATFKVARGDAGDRVLELAEDGVLDGLSAGVDFDSVDDWRPDPSDESVRLVRRATLREGSITALPAFDNARVTSVAANSSGGSPMPETTSAEPQAQAPEGQAPAGGSGPDLAAFTAGVSEALTAAVSQAFERLPEPQGRQSVPAGRVQVVREAPVYAFNGNGPSLVRDAWKARTEGDPDAQARLAKFRAQQDDMVATFQREPSAQFAVNTTNGANVIPPGYRPDLYVTQLMQGRPLVDSVSKGSLTDATPFTLPSFTSSSNASSDHTEGTNPSGGSLVIDSKTVTPGGISGLFELTREIVDSANPAIDAIAMQAMRESYSQQTEAKVYAELNGATGQGGTITSGFVPSGAQVSTTAGAAANTQFGGDKLLAGVRAALALYPFRRFAAPDRMHLSQEATSAFSAAVGTDGRPLLPSIGASNTAGVGNAQTQGWYVDGLPARPTWSMSGNAAGDADVLIYNSNDVWAWESSLLTFRFEERGGPARIDLALFGYFATRLLRPVGLASVRHTAVGA